MKSLFALCIWVFGFIQFCGSLGRTGGERLKPNRTKGGKMPLHIIGLFDLDGAWAGGLGQQPAVTLGIEHVNRDNRILKDYELQMVPLNTKCDGGLGTKVLFEQLHKPPVKIMVIGAGCSSVTQPTAQTSKYWNLIQLSYSSASPALSDRSIYTKFFRVFPPESTMNPAKIDLLQYFGWRSVATIHQTQDLFALATSAFIKDANAAGINIITQESFATEPSQQVKNLKLKDARIIVGNFYENTARQVFCHAYKQGMYGPKYVWIITGFFTQYWWKVYDPFLNCTEEEMRQAVEGYLTVDALPRSTSNKPGISGLTSDEFLDLYQKVTRGANQTGYQEAPYGYDAAWAAALMLNTSLAHIKAHKLNRSLEDFTYTDKRMADIFFRVMNNTRFEGVSGPVSFNEFGDRLGLMRIEQNQGGTEKMVGIYFGVSTNKSERLEWLEDSPIQWQGNGPPVDSTRDVLKPLVIKISLFICMSVFAGAGIVMAIGFLIFNVRFRSQKYIKMSSPNLNNLILVGAMFAYISIIFSGLGVGVVSDAAYEILCQMNTWLLSLGFSLAFGAMFSKTWRVHKIFTNKKMQRMVIKDYQLIAIVAALVMIDITILTVWEIVDPPSLVVVNQTSYKNPLDEDEIIIPQVIVCESRKAHWHFVGALYALKGLLLIFGAFLAWETRKVTVPALNDSKYIGLSVYNVVVLCAIGVPISFVMKSEVDLAYILISAFIFFATTFTICLVFIPKIRNRNFTIQQGTMLCSTFTNNEGNLLAPRRTPSLRGNKRSPEPTGGESSALVESENKEIESLREEVAKLQKMIATLQQQYDEATKELAKYTDKKIGTLNNGNVKKAVPSEESTSSTPEDARV